MQTPQTGWPIDYSGPREEVHALVEAHAAPDDPADDFDDFMIARAYLLDRLASTKAAHVGVFAQWKQNAPGRRGPNGWHLVLSFAEYEEPVR